MKVGDFELCIVGGLEGFEGNEIQMRHGQIYQLALLNHAKERCEVHVTIDGNRVGAWRIPSEETIVLEHPVNQDGRFTFLRLDSPEAKAAGVTADEESGQVIAWFVPEVDLSILEFEMDAARLAAAAPGDDEDGENAGATALTGKSEQEYGVAKDHFYGDWDTAVMVEVRLRAEPLPKAEYEKVLFNVFDCPDCGQRARVPVNKGRVRIKCPACECQFVRET